MANRTNELNKDLDGTNDPDRIRNEIEQTRLAMGHTIAEIQERLSPARLKEQTQEKIREATIGKVEDMTHRAEHEVRNWRTKLVRTIRENPVPAALIGVGVGWLMMSDNDTDYYQQSNRYYSDPDNFPERFRARSRPYETHRDVGDLVHDGRERVSEVMEGAKDRVSTAAHGIQERVSDMAESVQESASAARRQMHQTTDETVHHAQEAAAHLQTRAQLGMRHTKQTFKATMHENPLAVGATALAVGALVGLALPSTPTEDRWMGERRDELLEEAKESIQQQAEETVRKVKDVAAKAKDAAVETAKEETDNTMN